MGKCRIFNEKQNTRKKFEKMKKRAKVLKMSHRYIECKQGMQQFIQTVASLIILPFSNIITNQNIPENFLNFFTQQPPQWSCHRPGSPLRQFPFSG